MADENLRLVIDALDKASDDISKIKGQISGLDDATKKADASNKGFGDSWAIMMTGISSAISVAQQAAAAIGEIYEVAKEGAALELVETKFDNLTESIGSTADALMTDLREATSGMYSDAELMESAGGFMALGLAKTHDEVVRLSTVAGTLNMDMNQLVLTLTNQTTARFDQLGVSVDGFDEKVKELEATGMDVNKAFTEAFLQQAEKQIERVGSAADSSVADFMRLEAAAKNLGSAFKKQLSQDLQPVVEWAADGLNRLANYHLALDAAMEKGVITGDEYEDITLSVANFQMTQAEATEYLNGKIEAHTNALAENSESHKYATDPRYQLADATDYLAQKEIEAAQSAEEMTKKNEAFMRLTEGLSGVFADYSGELSDIAGEIDTVTAELRDLYDQQYLTTDQKERVAELEGEYAELVTQIQATAEAHREATNAMIYDLMTQKLSADGLNDAEFAVLMNLGEDLGVLEEGSANAAIELDKLLDGVLADGTATEDEMALIKDHVATFSETAPGAQEAMDAVLHQVRADGEVTADELVTIEDTLGALYSNASDRKAKMDEILTGFADEANRGFIDATGIEDTLNRLNGQTFETNLIVNITETGGTSGSGQAVGGSVSAGNPYLWQEYGYRGEVFVPSQNGYVLSRSDAERILSQAGKGQNTTYAGPSADDIARAVRDAILMAGVM